MADPIRRVGNPTYGDTATTERRRRVWPYLLAAAAGLALAAAAVGFIVFRPGSAAPATLDVLGQIRLTGGFVVDSENDRTCRGVSGYSDIGQGAPVVIHDETGKVVGVGQLAPGTASDAAGSACVFGFDVQDVPDGKFFGIEVSHRGTVTFTRQQIKDDLVRLNLG